MQKILAYCFFLILLSPFSSHAKNSADLLETVAEKQEIYCHVPVISLSKEASLLQYLDVDMLWDKAEQISFGEVYYLDEQGKTQLFKTSYAEFITNNIPIWIPDDSYETNHLAYRMDNKTQAKKNQYLVKTFDNKDITINYDEQVFGKFLLFEYSYGNSILVIYEQKQYELGYAIIKLDREKGTGVLKSLAMDERIKIIEPLKSETGWGSNYFFYQGKNTNLTEKGCIGISRAHINAPFYLYQLQDTKVEVLAEGASLADLYSSVLAGYSFPVREDTGIYMQDLGSGKRYPILTGIVQDVEFNIVDNYIYDKAHNIVYERAKDITGSHGVFFYEGGYAYEKTDKIRNDKSYYDYIFMIEVEGVLQKVLQLNSIFRSNNKGIEYVYRNGARLYIGLCSFALEYDIEQQKIIRSFRISDGDEIMKRHKMTSDGEMRKFFQGYGIRIYPFAGTTYISTNDLYDTDK